MMGHGLVLSLFMLGPSIAATALARSGSRVGKFSGSVAAWILTFALVICKSTGVWLYGLIALPAVRFAKPRTVINIAFVIMVITCAYPLLRSQDWLPIYRITDYAGRLTGGDRSQSLAFRFFNEDMLLEKAMLRPLFGWGGYGRPRVYDNEGVDICVTDGIWIMQLGGSGIIGTAFSYCFSVIPVVMVRRRLSRIRDAQQRNMLAALALMCALMWFDTLPNAPNFLLVQFIGGALCSISSTILQDQRRKDLARRQEKAGQAAGFAPVAAAV
jgi:hypothetical protein